MFNDNFKNKISSSNSLVLAPAIEEEVMDMNFDEKRHWKVTDVLTYPDGRKETRNYVNTVVDDCSRLIASLMKGHTGMSGISYWAVGSGAGSWDNANPPSPTVGDTKLVNETFRKPVTLSDISFLDANDAVTQTVTNKIQIKLVFNENEANGELREFGLYGGNATATRGSGIMINRKTHGLLYKTSGMTLERTIRIVF